MKKTILRHILVKLQKIKGKEKNLSSYRNDTLNTTEQLE